MDVHPNGQSAEVQKFLRIDDVKAATGLSRSSIYNMMRDRSFPAAVRISARLVAWRASDVSAWQASKEPKQSGGQ